MILGIDPGYGRLGFAVLSSNSPERLLDMGLITTDSKDPFPKRLSVIRLELISLIDEYAVKEVAVEKLFFSINKKTAMDVAHARGVMLELFHAKGLSIFEYAPTQVKKAVAGHAQSSKEAIVSMMKKLYKIEFETSYDDAYDALAIAFTHKMSLNARISRV